MSTDIKDFVNKIDWDLLARQKLWLIDHSPSEEDDWAINGLVNLLDNLQDVVVNSDLVCEDVVFGPSYSVRKINVVGYEIVDASGETVEILQTGDSLFWSEEEAQEILNDLLLNKNSVTDNGMES